MSEHSPSDSYSHAYPGATFTSQFFAHFIDRSHTDSDPSLPSPNGSLLRSEDEQQEFSVNEDKLREFHAMNLVSIAQTIAKRKAVRLWAAEKERAKRIEERTPHRVAKSILKVFYSLEVKLQVKYSFAFRKLQRLAQEARDKGEPPKAREEVKGQEQSNNLQTSGGQSKNGSRKEGAGKLAVILSKIHLKYSQSHDLRAAFDSLHQQSLRAESVETITGIFQQVGLEVVCEGWRSLRNWLILEEKVEILVGTLRLLVHPAMREGLWAITALRQSLEDNDISNIQEAKSRKESFKMNNSTESIALQKELLDHIPHLDQLKRRENEALGRHDPKLLKFSKDVKRKTAPLSLAQQEDEQNETANGQHSQLIAGMACSEPSEIKQPNEDLSMMRRNSATMNTSLCQSKSMLKKVLYPLELAPERSCRVTTGLQEDGLPLALNEGAGNKQFQNSSRVFKPKAVKHEELRREFTDFNDLFSAREILSFYQAARGGAGEERRGISLARIKEKVNVRTQEEYYSRDQLRTDPAALPASETDLAPRRACFERTLHSIKSSNSLSRSRHDSKDRSRKAEARIPSELPKHFDYYVDKSWKEARGERERAGPPEVALSGRGKSATGKSRKKLLFNVVKSGSTRASAEQQERKRASLEGDGARANRPKLELPSSRPKIDLPKRSKDPRQTKQSLSPAGHCEYFMTFREPPRKKIKKGILKNDI